MCLRAHRILSLEKIVSNLSESNITENSIIENIFSRSRSLHKFLDKPVSDETLKAIYERAKWAPTGFNAQPARLLFLKSQEAKARLAPALSNSNREKTLAAPVNVIIAWDSRFHDQLPTQFPAYDARPLFENNASLIESTGKINAALQASFFLLAARSFGLDAGPMSGFSNEAIDAEFFKDNHWKSLLLVNLGYGDYSAVKPRGPRLAFKEAAAII
jgi:3-hydroxypropanoate dehydrogenase